eukprot:scaffold54842_cov30-Attheya_sp.AAC.2
MRHGSAADRRLVDLRSGSPIEDWGSHHFLTFCFPVKDPEAVGPKSYAIMPGSTSSYVRQLVVGLGAGRISKSGWRYHTCTIEAASYQAPTVNTSRITSSIIIITDDTVINKKADT